MLNVIKTPLQIPDTSKTLEAFYRWINIFVAHFLAKRTLEYHSARIFEAHPHNFAKSKIKILAVKSEDYKVPHWDQFKRVIREALTDVTETEVDSIINTLEEKVKAKKDRLHFFCKVMECEVKSMTLRMHCEAVFAALLEARYRAESSASNDADLKTLAKFFKVLGLVSRCKNASFHIFPDLAGGYGFSFQIVLPRLLGAFQSSSQSFKFGYHD
jgi:hypothetical protein